MGYAYSSPVSFRAWDTPSDLMAGEVYFDLQPSADDLATAFPGYVAPVLPTQFTFLQFLALFTGAEQTAIVSSGDTNVKIFLLMAAGASYINLADPSTTNGLAYLVSVGLLTQGRQIAILAAPAPSA